MDVLLIYFSQTGNTRKVAKAMAGGLREAGHAAWTVPLTGVKGAVPRDVLQCDLLGVGTPCFASQAPTPVKKFLRALPPLDGRRAFVFATSGGAPGRVLYDLTSLLRGKGADVVGGFLTHGTTYHPAPCLNGRMPGRPNKVDLDSARRFAVAVGEHVLAGRTGPVAESRVDAFRPGWGFYDLVAMMSKDPMVRLVLPAPRLDEAKCDRCGWCIFECPMGNILLQPYPVIGRQCIRCYRCLTGCPQKAFDADWRFGNLPILAFYNPVFERWFGDLQPGESLYQT